MYDYYSGVLDAEKNVMAIFAATRIGKTFTEVEMSEIDGIMNRVSLALERTLLYEKWKRRESLIKIFWPMRTKVFNLFQLKKRFFNLMKRFVIGSNVGTLISKRLYQKTDG
ncbi:hypothetical protein [Salipaludibacillus keqinensis]|uniref:hypothetical protein n=1 Tax=Salipaludibacillus keqinensis TaxID=2045207 RepID=UPI0011AF2582|nr:hypothetical protein [Salipaludibacillus keqinensis]